MRLQNKRNLPFSRYSYVNFKGGEKLAICQGINPTFWSKEKASDRIDESVFPDSTAFFESVKPGIVKIVCLIHCAGLYLFKSFSFDPRRIECSIRRWKSGRNPRNNFGKVEICP